MLTKFKLVLRRDAAERRLAEIERLSDANLSTPKEVKKARKRFLKACRAVDNWQERAS